jgi:hypothetical protein
MKCFKKVIEYENFSDPIEIIPIGDIHYGSSLCDVNALKKTLKNNPKAHYIFNGDVFDAIVPNDPRYQKSGDNIKGDAMLDIAVNDVANIIMPYRKEILGIGHGNHEQQAIKRYGTSLVGRLCHLLECDHFGYSGILRLALRRKSSNIKTIDIYYHHGFGGGCKTEGGNLTKFWRHAKGWDADIFLYAHVHDIQSDSRSRCGWGNPVASKDMHLVICGTYKKTFTETVDATWEETKGFHPVHIGSPIIRIYPQSNGWVDIKVET